MEHTKASDEMLFSLCYTKILGTLNQVRKYKKYPSKAEAIAQVAICQMLFELAAGAAVRQNFKKDVTDALVDLMQEVRDFFEWNNSG